MIMIIMRMLMIMIIVVIIPGSCRGGRPHVARGRCLCALQRRRVPDADHTLHSAKGGAVETGCSGLHYIIHYAVT